MASLKEKHPFNCSGGQCCSTKTENPLLDEVVFALLAGGCVQRSYSFVDHDALEETWDLKTTGL